MNEGVSLFPPPTTGWQWEVQEVNVNWQVFFAVVQQRLPAPPSIVERLLSEMDASHGVLGLAIAVMALWGKVRQVFKRSSTEGV